MPMKNAEAFVAAAMQSVLAERRCELELIVIDDGSTDRSAQIVRSVGDPRVRLIPGPQKGIAASNNAGLDAARGQFLARCDADDLFTPGRLFEQVEWLRAHPEFGAICGGFSTIDPAGGLIDHLHKGQQPAEITDELRNGQVRTHLNTYTIRTDHLRRIGGFRSFFVTSSDIDLQLRLGEVCRVWFEPTERYLYRLHDASITHQRNAHVRDFFEISARRFQQQRREQGQDDLQRGTPPAIPDFPEGCSPAAGQIQGMLIGRAWRSHREGRRLQALGVGLRALAMKPSSWPAWKSLIALLIKPAPRSPSSTGRAA